MTKEVFLAELRSRLSGLPREDAAERLAFYSEMIDDRMEEGCSESEAVAGVGPIDRIVSQTLSEIPLKKLMKEKISAKRALRGWEITLLVLGFPLWFPLLIAAAAVLFSVYVVIWALVVSLWAVAVSFLAGAFAGLAVGIVNLCRGEQARGLALIGAGLVLAGLSIFLFFGCRAATLGAARMTKALAGRIKALFLRKERAE